jgi:hypothetical protein
MPTHNVCWYCGIEVPKGIPACDRHFKEIRKEAEALRKEYEDYLLSPYGLALGDDDIKYGSTYIFKKTCSLCLENAMAKGFCKYHYELNYHKKPLYNSDGDVILPNDRHKSANLSVV